LTANELLALLGRAWPRLLLYPGGLFAFGVVAVLVWAQQRRSAEPWWPPRWWTLYSWRDLSALVVPWLGLALLPLPRAASLSRQFDLVMLLALLEWPLLLAVATELRGSPDERAQRLRRFAAALNSYPLLIVAALLMVAAYGSLEGGVLLRTPDADTPFQTAALFWLGALGWLLVLPAALGLGAFAAGAPANPWLRLGLRLRMVGLVALAALPWIPLVADPITGHQAEAELPWLALPLPPLVIAGLLWVWHRATLGRSPRGWAWAMLVLTLGLVGALLWAATTALQARLT
jgi:hypothetical protein